MVGKSPCYQSTAKNVKWKINKKTKMLKMLQYPGDQSKKTVNYRGKNMNKYTICACGYVHYMTVWLNYYKLQEKQSFTVSAYKYATSMIRDIKWSEILDIVSSPYCTNAMHGYMSLSKVQSVGFFYLFSPS